MKNRPRSAGTGGRGKVSEAGGRTDGQTGTVCWRTGRADGPTAGWADGRLGGRTGERADGRQGRLTDFATMEPIDPQDVEKILKTLWKIVLDIRTTS